VLGGLERKFLRAGTSLLAHCAKWIGVGDPKPMELVGFVQAKPLQHLALLT